MAFQFRDLMMNVIPGDSIRWELTCGPLSVDDGIRREDPDSEPKPPKEKDKDKDKKDKPAKDEMYFAQMADLQQQLRQALQQGL